MWQIHAVCAYYKPTQKTKIKVCYAKVVASGYSLTANSNHYYFSKRLYQKSSF